MEPPSFTRILVPPYYRMQPKIFKNLALYCCWACLKVSKMVCHNLIAQKLTKKIGSLKMGFCQIRALVVGPMGMITSPNNMTFVHTNCENLEKIQTFSQKVFNLCPQTDTHFASAIIFSIQKFIPLHFTTFICLLCSHIHSICEDNKSIKYPL